MTCSHNFSKRHKRMKKLLYSGALLGVFALTLPPAASAQEDTSAATPSSSSYLSLGAGYYDIFDNDSSGDFRVEYTSGEPLFWVLKPWGGVEATTEGSLWGGGGLKAGFMVAPNIYVDPSVGVGLYSDGGDDTDLGSAIEFRTQLESGYQFTNGHRVGVALGHISNAGIGDENPGAETLNLYYHMPVGNLF
jgi:lipid A 3-O-deacylase